MAVFLFPDNTVLINFAIINRMDLLKRLANGNGRWCSTVASECDSSAREPGLGALVDARGIFGSPWFPDAAELQDARLLRDELARTEWVDADTLWEYIQTLRTHRRGSPPDVTDRPSFDKWLAS